MPVRCDIFCAVIDNLGDAGVCWRLARQLATEFRWRVRLFIDAPALIARLAPGQRCVEVRPWAGALADVEAADVVLEAFACPLPPRYVEAMAARRPRPPVWINLEYLSAEDWVAGCHGLPSPQPGLPKFFFFPGFVPGTGGLLREKNLAVPMLAANPAAAVSPAPTFDGPLDISLFCYDNPQLPALLAAWRDGDRPIVCHVCAGLPRQQVERWLGGPLPAAVGHLTLAALPFLPQTDYDALLARCHLNFVRGEDSFVRAQWAERPFVWQAYPQAEGAHRVKLDAFLARYLEKVGVGGTAAGDFFRAWNGAGALDWPAFAQALPALAAHAPVWARRIRAHGDLATNLVAFCTARL
jgi:uncharacterized repeat protein (TIGR03837 family)